MTLKEDGMIGLPSNQNCKKTSPDTDAGKARGFTIEDNALAAKVRALHRWHARGAAVTHPAGQVSRFL